MSKIKPTRKKLPARRLIVYLLITLFLVAMILLWERYIAYLTP